MAEAEAAAPTTGTKASPEVISQIEKAASQEQANENAIAGTSVAAVTSNWVPVWAAADSVTDYTENTPY